MEINCVLAEHFDFVVASFWVGKVKAGQPWLRARQTGYIKIKNCLICFEISCKQNIKDKHLGGYQLISAMTCHEKLLVITCD